MRIAIIGAGISGLVTAHLLHDEHEITVFEAADHIGGHTNTRRVTHEGQTFAVDTGFIVFNEPHYPNFVKLLNRLGVASQPSNMSFSVRCERSGLEYNGSNLNSLFSQRRNLLRPAFYRMLQGILRFHREAPRLLEDADWSVSLQRYLEENGYSREFVDHYIIPLGASIWSAPGGAFGRIPAAFFVSFMHHHGMLQVRDRVPWRVIKGGSQEYVRALVAPFRERIRLSCPIAGLRRTPTGVRLQTASGEAASFDRVVLATHSDQALQLLEDPTPEEQQVLGAIPYQANDTVLHVDRRLLPRRRRAWASWNYHILATPSEQVAITYNMNMLQSLRSADPFCVTLNRSSDIDPHKALYRVTYHHPAYTEASVAAQKQHDRINGRNNTYYCGAYWGYGFHEDGVNSAMQVCRHFERTL